MLRLFLQLPKRFLSLLLPLLLILQVDRWPRRERMSLRLAALPSEGEGTLSDIRGCGAAMGRFTILEIEGLWL